MSCIKTTGCKIRNSMFENDNIVSCYFVRYYKIADNYGDVCRRGFLRESIEKREATGQPFPLCLNHDLNQIIGTVTSIIDRSEGAFMTAKFSDIPRAQEVRNLIKSGVAYQLSFTYKILEAGRVHLPDGTRANELRKCVLYEISLVPMPGQGEV